MKHLTTIITRLLPTATLGLLLGACSSLSPIEWNTCPSNWAPAGGATKQNVRRVKSALNEAGIPNYANDFSYADPDVPYQMFVPPTTRQRAAEIIKGVH